jgi:glycosyltransferase involved in cell wall biosynthesis
MTTTSSATRVSVSAALNGTRLGYGRSVPPPRVVVNAQIAAGGAAGGTEQFVASLVHALGRLEGEEAFVVVGPAGAGDWLEPYLGPNQQLVEGPTPVRPVGTRRLSHRVAWALDRPAAALGRSDGFFEGLGDVVHFPFQWYAPCRVPTVFNPHDLQHVHYPEFFTPEQIAYRRRAYRGACRLATVVAVESGQTRDDVVREYGVDPAKVEVVHRGPPPVVAAEPTAARLEEVKARLELPETFAIYPAQTWPHKNHLALVRALALLRDRDGLSLTLVCPGRRNDFFPTIEAEVERLGLSDQVRFPGYFEAADLQALYRLATFLVFPSLFEGGGIPITEAFRERLPIACSDTPALREYAGDAAVLFDASSPEAIAAALRRLATDDRLRAGLVERGKRRLERFSWDEAARRYQALYRRLAR